MFRRSLSLLPNAAAETSRRTNRSGCFRVWLYRT
jgi:hypothetical protein